MARSTTHDELITKLLKRPGVRKEVRHMQRRAGARLGGSRTKQTSPPLPFAPLTTELPSVHYTLDCEQEGDGRWIAEMLELPGVMAYGTSRDEAILKTEALALRVIAERLGQREAEPTPIHLALPASPSTKV